MVYLHLCQCPPLSADLNSVVPLAFDFAKRKPSFLRWALASCCLAVDDDAGGWSEEGDGALGCWPSGGENGPEVNVGERAAEVGESGVGCEEGIAEAIEVCALRTKFLILSRVPGSR